MRRRDGANDRRRPGRATPTQDSTGGSGRHSLPRLRRGTDGRTHPPTRRSHGRDGLPRDAAELLEAGASVDLTPQTVFNGNRPTPGVHTVGLAQSQERPAAPNQPGRPPGRPSHPTPKAKRRQLHKLKGAPQLTPATDRHGAGRELPPMAERLLSTERNIKPPWDPRTNELPGTRGGSVSNVGLSDGLAGS